ncbi:hypothetical protein AB0B04_19705 [Streptomyces xinghaiensis]|uniref:Uncharacterized protein n=2 Tax=Streptomyces TaxID=1883 RepID=A0A3R7F4I3_9ACTN|nr:hypothetical protein [Streptomyces fradiae]PQM19505.1 hypothetical protein Sfr7A_31835 [Streptomyces xinghaiensis]KNE80738.1 hypothetical protein ADZ36_20370 [Streptomyces fradiae]OFA50946.1 hypothetical protein BEN35_15045 [Streptomyces fradiae]RKM90981.1 hypothetical protein SFRA_030625 [Streptomyces xinghaiensis]RNC68983.1 hypothetical protein DC095_030870 [Streptomyces xinghaiensis]
MDLDLCQPVTAETYLTLHSLVAEMLNSPTADTHPTLRSLCSGGLIRHLAASWTAPTHHVAERSGLPVAGRRDLQRRPGTRVTLAPPVPQHR